MSDTYAAPAILAAEQYRRAAEMAGKARQELITAAIRERSMVKLRGLAEVAGVDENTLRAWIRRNGNGS
jgi:uncharacterized protein YjcR